MALFLVQHGKSFPKDIDPDQGLSEEGIEVVKQIATVAKGYNVHVSSIEHSVKKRARQTAEIMGSVLSPQDGVHEKNGLKPLDDVKAVASRIKSENNNMLVGHQPFMGNLTSYLVTGTIDIPVFIFQNGGILCLDTDPNNRESWAIKWSLMPNIG